MNIGNRMNKINLPDFDDLLELSNTIATLTREKIILENRIKLIESNVVKECMTNAAYWTSGKQPSMDYVKSTWMVSGFDDELLPYKEQLADVVSSLEKCKMQFQVYRDLVDVWRTISANERAAAL